MAQQPVDGVSLLAALDDPAAPELHHTQYFEMMGSRSIYHEGWKATTNHISTGILDEEELAVGSRNFDDDRWELFDLSADFSEATDRADDEPERLQRLRDLWDAEAERNHVLPISDGLVDRFGGFIPPAWPAGIVADLPARRRPGRRRVRPAAVGRVRHHGRHRHATATRRRRRLRAGRLVRRLRALPRGRAWSHFTFARAGDALELAMPSALGAGRHELAVSYAVGEGDAPGRMVLLVDGAEVDATTVEGMLPLAVQHGGAGLRLGWDSGFPVSPRYAPPAPFDGTVHGSGRHARALAARPGRRGARRAPRRLTRRALTAPAPLTRRGDARQLAQLLDAPRPGGRALGGGPDGQALQQRVDRRRHAVEGAQEHDLAVEELGLDRPRPAGQALPAGAPLPLPRRRRRHLQEVTAPRPVLLGARDVDARRRQRLLALALRLARQRAEAALGPASASTALARFMRSLRYFQRMMSGRATDWKVVVAMASAMAWPWSSRPDGKRPRSSSPRRAPSAPARHRAAAGWPGTSRTCRRCGGSGAARGARSPPRSACRPPASPGGATHQLRQRVVGVLPLHGEQHDRVAVGVALPRHLRRVADDRDGQRDGPLGRLEDEARLAAHGRGRPVQRA